MDNMLLLLENQNNKSLDTFLDNLSCKVLNINPKQTDFITSEIIDEEFIEQIKNLPLSIKVAFGKSLRDLKCSVSDIEGIRNHEVYLKYSAPRKLVVTSVMLPYSTFQEREYSSIQEVVTTFRNYLSSLANYFYELECLDNQCTVMEPTHPTFKDDYRKIVLDGRTWLHIGVTTDGLPTNIHLIGQSEIWQDKLRTGLLKWDHDKSIVENIISIFDIKNSLVFVNQYTPQEPKINEEKIACGICFCEELPDNPGIPRPICQNMSCGVFFHNFCLYQWLVACEGGRPPAFGVANGNCPTCLHPIACSEKDS